jgi:hypothetical protein
MGTKRATAAESCRPSIKKVGGANLYAVLVAAAPYAQRHACLQERVSHICLVWISGFAACKGSEQTAKVTVINLFIQRRYIMSP